MKKNKQEIIAAAKENDVRMWEIAEALGMSEATFCRKKRVEFNESEKNMILEVIQTIAKQKNESGDQASKSAAVYKNGAYLMYKNILSMLPKQPRSFDTSDDPGYWTNGAEILCPTETECEIVADFLEDVFSEYGDVKMHTGYYDPDEDARSGEMDDNTGFYYIDIDD